MRGFVLEADETRLAAFTSAMYTDPCEGRVTYTPWTGYVLMLLGGFDNVSCTVPPFSGFGGVCEVQASFWLPLVASRPDPLVPDRLVLAVPYILVDNPMSYLGGREVYGYAKTMGRFAPASGLGQSVTVEAYGGNYGPGNKAAWQPFLEVSSPTGAPSSQPVWEGMAELLAGLAPGLLAHPELLVDLVAGTPTQVFLKQFRDARDGTRACYQAVIEAPVKIKRATGRLLDGDWIVAVQALDSHPLVSELGLVTPQVATLALEIETDFVVAAGSPV